MTWKEFKEAVETAGVKDDYEISYIDCDASHDVKVHIYLPRNSEDDHRVVFNVE